MFHELSRPLIMTKRNANRPTLRTLEAAVMKQIRGGYTLTYTPTLTLDYSAPTMESSKYETLSNVSTPSEDIEMGSIRNIK